MLQLGGTALGANLLSFAVAQLILHVTMGLVCLGAAHVCTFAWQRAGMGRRVWSLLWFIVLTVWLLLANAAWYPTSSMGQSYAPVALLDWNGVRLLDLTAVLCGVVAVATLGRALLRCGARRVGKAAAFAVLSVLMAGMVVSSVSLSTAASSASHRPNVILLGMDSLRVDALGKGNTPFIDEFLRQSVVFEDALTPIARTFPAWVSIITGRHPHSTGATTNLMPRHLIAAEQTLPTMLRRAGYASFYSIDDARFSNLDGSFGFDQVLTPPMGATDFVLGFLSDTPLSNIVTNTFVGRLLFPHSHANRASVLTYEPSTFIDRIDAELPAQRPMLVITHLTLAHMPYTWGDKLPLPRASDGTVSLAALYEHAVAGLDRQFAAYFAMLEAKGLLEDAIVVVLSDHGESLGEPCPVVQQVQVWSPAAAPGDCHFFGHGSSVLARDQYRVLLAARTFGSAASLASLLPQRVSLPTSLEDITPTLIDLLDLPLHQQYDGRSLAPILRGAPLATASFSERIRFVETEFNPRDFNHAAPSHDAVRRASSHYQVDAITDRVTLREREMPAIDPDRQRGAWRGGRLLVADPDEMGTFRLIYSTGSTSLRPIVDAASLDSEPHARELWAALQGRFPELTAAVKLGE